jgi:hypothetical protein
MMKGFGPLHGAGWSRRPARQLSVETVSPRRTPTLPPHVAGIEFHDGSVHRNLGCMPERIVVDEEFRGE